MIFSIRDVNVTVQVGSNVHGKVQAATACEEKEVRSGHTLSDFNTARGLRAPRMVTILLYLPSPLPFLPKLRVLFGALSAWGLRASFAAQRLACQKRTPNLDNHVMAIAERVFITRYASRPGERGRGHGRVRIPQMRRCPNLLIATCTSHFARLRAGVCVE